MSALLQDSLTFVGLLAAIYAATVALYFILGYGITWLNDRNPERRIQKGRRGEKRKAIEIRQSMASILVTCTSVAIGLFVQYKGWTLFSPWEFRWWAAVPLFVLCMVLFDAWFYFAHRLLHTKLFYKYHLLHHRSVAPTVWSNDSIGLVDTAMSQGYYAVITFLVPFPPIILLAHRLFDQINGTFGHAGFEYFASRTARYPSPMLCTTYHDQHHAEFKYNYANYFSFWDRVMGTVAPNYDRRVAAFEGNTPAISFRKTSSAAVSDVSGSAAEN
ncbi:sterol desaturase family protein (plasmid) [Ensifer adhaerens]|uniref:sterol desaturase family protein n=1 Tax=Ensifer adhaerens TaxID=106592 RepID=UPI002100DC65|nr:sterol desaturase family protein [Ensifer adhaerens]UTV39272.1 sterol desaturase family protein [Ensifer adhaerens]